MPGRRRCTLICLEIFTGYTFDGASPRGLIRVFWLLPTLRLKTRNKIYRSFRTRDDEKVESENPKSTFDAGMGSHQKSECIFEISYRTFTLHFDTLFDFSIHDRIKNLTGYVCENSDPESFISILRPISKIKLTLPLLSRGLNEVR